MKTRITAALTTAGLSVLLLTSCVSSKKYKASQAALQSARNDSAQLAQQVSSLTQNVNSMEQRNKSLQQSLDSTSGMYTTQQKNLDYYTTYFNNQQSNLAQISQELKDALAQNGVTDQDMQQTDGAIYINLDEDTLFKGNATTVSKRGEQVLTGIADVIKKHDDVVVNVDNGVTATASTASTTDQSSMSSSSGMSNNSSSMSTARKPRRTSTASTASKPSTSSTASSSTTSSSTARTTVKKKAPRKYSTESGSMTYRNNGTASNKRSSADWSRKTGRVNAVAKGLLKNGVPKVHVAQQQMPDAYNPSMDGKKIKVVVRPVLKDFTPPTKSSSQQ